MGIKLDDVYGSGEWLKAEDLQGRQVLVQISKIGTTTFKDKRTGSEKHQIVLHFTDKEKTLGLNVTNAKRIATILGSKDTDDWIGKQIVLFPTEVESFGEYVLAIRVKEYQGNNPAPPPVVVNSDVDDDIPF